jgi:anti-sigma B factor antagonist
MAPFDAMLQKRNGTAPVYLIAASGRLDASGVAILSERLNTVRADPVARVIFDLEKLTFVGSAGIGLFLSFVEEIREAGGDARFVNVPASVHAVLALLNVTDFLTQAANEETAVTELLP